MKKLLFLLVMALPLFVYANEKNEVEEAPKSSAYVILATRSIDLSSITFPYILNVPAPSETIIGISGPSHPNIQNWKITNGILSITYTADDFINVFPGTTSYIEVATNPMKYYAIEINAY